MGSHLNDPMELSGRIANQLALADRLRQGFFDVYILARVAGEQSHMRVPVVRRGDDDGINVLVFEEAPESPSPGRERAFERFRAAARSFARIASSMSQKGLDHGRRRRWRPG
jgi:type VI protein secretion system component VasA